MNDSRFLYFDKGLNCFSAELRAWELCSTEDYNCYKLKSLDNNFELLVHRVSNQPQINLKSLGIYHSKVDCFVYYHSCDGTQYMQPHFIVRDFISSKGYDVTECRASSHGAKL